MPVYLNTTFSLTGTTEIITQSDLLENIKINGDSVTIEMVEKVELVKNSSSYPDVLELDA